MVHPGAAPLSEDEIQGLRATIERGDYESGAGGLSERSPREDYFDTIARMIRPARRLKVVVDAGNGVAGLYGPEVLRRIGCDVIELHCESDGSFANRLPDPADERNVEDRKLKGVDDVILASCKIIAMAARATEPLSRLFASVPHLRATPELKAPCPDGEKFRVVDEVTRELKRRYETIDTDGARVIFPGRGWGLVRASNTNPYLTLRFEARTDAEIEEMKLEIYDVLRRYPFVTLPG